MRVLAIETTERVGTVALSEGDRLVVQRSLDAGQRSAQSLAPAVVQTLADAGWKPEDVELVAVTVGPGSFTGLRVGVTTAKTFAYGVGAQ
ncbi:MAG TPA: tRNA (adenosine(37)-N6)-threonylcarbamoyltransferase complex dimerization subunit type 1 TsaB, partial [Planctomycetaceae bacterium]|nr:tRNA (adenosine(37)-N6)-threonylcarbamoyltransferase complex dimerization subunit type 1 TsaB [Planctomycetaceae bacterium]